MRQPRVRNHLLAGVLLAFALAGCSGKHASSPQHTSQASTMTATVSTSQANTLYLIANDHLVALDARTRAVRWTDSRDEFSAAISPVYDNGVVYAIQVSDGAARWQTGEESGIPMRMELSHGVLYVTTRLPPG